MGLKEQIKAIVVKKPAVALEDKEACIFQVKCQLGRQALQTTTTTKPGVGIGVGVRVIGPIGVGVGTRKVKTTTKTEMVWQKEGAVLLLTTKRILFKVGKEVYQMNFEGLQDVKLNKDAITLVCYGNPYYFFMKAGEVKRFAETWALMSEAGKQGVTIEDII